MTNRNLKSLDTPWHVGFALKDEDDPRRHKSRCTYYNNTTQKCGTKKSPYFMLKCGGSAHCKFYSEISDTKKENKVSANQSNNKHNKPLDCNHERIIKKKEFISDKNISARRKSVNQLKSCPICAGELSLYIKMPQGKKCPKGIELGKKCYLCSTVFIDKDMYEIHIKKFKKEKGDVCLMKLYGRGHKISTTL